MAFPPTKHKSSSRTPPRAPPRRHAGPARPPMGGGGLPPALMSIMQQLPPEVLQAIATNPQAAMQQFMPMILGQLGGGGGGGSGVSPQAFSGNAPAPPAAQGAIAPSTEEELAMAQQNMGAAPRQY